MSEMKRIELLVVVDLVGYNLVRKVIHNKMSLEELEKKFRNKNNDITLESGVQYMLMLKELLLEDELNDVPAEDQLEIIKPILAMLIVTFTTYMIGHKLKSDSKTKEEIFKKLKDLGLTEGISI